jgi:ATP-binding cassette, subfamily C, bacterial CydD
MAVMLVIGLVITASYVVQGLLVADALIQVLVDGRLDGVVPVLVMAVALTLARGALVWWQESVGAALGERVCAELRTRLYRQLVRLGPAWLEQTRTGAVQTTLTAAVEAMEKYFRMFVVQAVVSAIGATAIVIYLCAADLVVGVFLAGCVLVAGFGPMIGWRILGPRSGFWWVQAPALSAEYLDSLQGMPTLKVFGATRSRRQILANRSQGLRDAWMGVLRAECVTFAPVWMMTTAGMVLGGGIGALRLTQGAIGPAELLVILILARECFRPVADFKLALHLAYPGIAAAECILDLLDAQPAITEGGTTTPPLAAPSIRFESVTFSYPTGNRAVISDLSFELSSGEHVAIVGSSGAGKSTVVALLMRFCDPSAGRILIDGLDIGDLDLDLDYYRSRLAIVSQDTYLFHGTVRDNLLLARPDASAAEMEDACRAANATEFIHALPQGYDTVVAERGVRLSGGQRQRIAIARALLANAPILILDEATSSVDVASEAAIHQALDRLTAGRTTLVIAHRLSSIRDADRILVLDRGRLVEQGAHLDLHRAGGTYHRLVQAQEPR